MRIPLISLMLLVVLIPLADGARTQPPKPAKGDYILCYGDSITLVGRSNPYAAILGRIFKSARPQSDVKVAREFMDGARTTKLAANFDQRVLKKHPNLDWLVIQDAGTAEPISAFEPALREIIGKCLKRKVKVVLVTTPEIERGPFRKKRSYTPGNKGNRFAKHNEFRRKLAKKMKGVYLVDLEAEWHNLMAATDKIGDKLTYDGCHPYETGLAAIAVVLARDFGIKRSEVKYASLGTYKDFTEAQLNVVLNVIYKKKKGETK